MAPLTGLAATDVTLAAPDGTFIEVVKPWRGWQHADGEDWVKVEVDGSSPLLGAFYLAAGGSMLLRATMSILEWLGFEGLYLCLSPADDQGLPRLDAMDQCMLLPNTYLRVKDLAVVKWTGGGFAELDSSKYVSCHVPAVKPWVAQQGVDTYTIERDGMPLSSLRLYCEKWGEQLGGNEQEPCTSSSAKLPEHIQVHLNDSGELFKYTCTLQAGCKLKTKRLEVAMQHNCLESCG